ncbi:MAG: hypothetical protein K2X81_17765, partial [Candidatus Obscuribacterales bacterium]|nr:hypothetical protein [Candidatus Obscuribacterales bacterium]
LFKKIVPTTNELHGDKFDKQQIGCIAYKAEAEWKQGNYKSAETDFNKAIELANKSHYDDAINDVLELRVSLRLRQRRFAEALTDVRTAHDSFERLVAQTGAITYFLLNEQSLDKDGQPRFDIFQEHIDELVLLVPKTVEESVQLIDLSNCVAGCAIDGEHAREAIKCVKFSESLLANVAAEKQIEFRKQIKNLELRIAKIRRGPSIIR